jgi:hypothetical protein
MGQEYRYSQNPTVLGLQDAVSKHQLVYSLLEKESARKLEFPLPKSMPGKAASERRAGFAPHLRHSRPDGWPA